jgi:hypothetical protein
MRILVNCHFLQWFPATRQNILLTPEHEANESRRVATQEFLMRYPAVIVIFFLITGAAFAQTESARIAGRVTGLFGAVIVGAQCKITNIETNVSTIAASNEDGIYVIPDLHPAIYRLTIQKEGFRTVVQPRLQLYVQDAVNENFTLAIGPIKQLKAAQMAREHLSGMLINAEEAERGRLPLVEWI